MNKITQNIVWNHIIYTKKTFNQEITTVTTQNNITLKHINNTGKHMNLEFCLYINFEIFNVHVCFLCYKFKYLAGYLCYKFKFL